MIINHNIAALNTYRQLGAANKSQSNSMEKLSSGLRINKAGDDAAGLAISEKMRAQVRGLDMAAKNAQDGISLIQTAEGALNESHAILQRMRELAVQSSSDTNTDSDRVELQKEVNQLATELTRIGNTTEFNTQTLLDGEFKGTFHIGANEGQNLSVSINDMRASVLSVGLEYEVVDGNNIEYVDPNGDGEETLTAIWVDAEDYDVEVSGYYNVEDADSATDDDLVIVVDGEFTFNSAEGANNKGTAGIIITSQEDADDAITIINNAIETVSAERSKLGATQNRLEHTINNLGTSSENLTAAESRIRDVDMAKEIMELSKDAILSQAAQAMLAQANQQPQAVLQLLN